MGGTLYAATRVGAGGGAITNGLLLQAGSSVLGSFTVSTAIAAVTNAAAIVFTHVFQYRVGLARPSFLVPAPSQMRGRLRWQVTAAGPAGTTGRINVDIFANGVAIPGVTKSTGPTRALDALGTFVEQPYVIDLNNQVELRPRQTLDVRVEFQVVVNAVGAATILVHHDPETALNQAVFEFDG